MVVVAEPNMRQQAPRRRSILKSVRDGMQYDSVNEIQSTSKKRAIASSDKERAGAVSFNQSINNF